MPGARTVDDQPVDMEGFAHPSPDSWFSQTDHTALATTPIPLDYGFLTGSADLGHPPPSVQNSFYHPFESGYPRSYPFSDYPGCPDQLAGCSSVAGDVTNNNPSDGRETYLGFYPFPVFEDLQVPSRSPIAADQALVPNIDTKPFPSNPPPLISLPCRNESPPPGRSTFTQDAPTSPTSHNPSAHGNTTSMSTKASAYKTVVATPGILLASQKRRKAPARFTCDSEGCNSDFTRKSSLHTKLISIRQRRADRHPLQTT